MRALFFVGLGVLGCGGRRPLECPADAPSRSGFSEEKVYEQYEVSGDSPNEFTAAARKNRPFEAPQYAKATGNTDSRLCLRFAFSFDDKGCKITAVSLLHRVRITLPRWKRPASLSPKQVDWDVQSSAKLLAHEEGHYALSAESARALYQDVLGVTTAATCAELKQKIQAIGAAHVEALNNKQVEYDETTQHGTLAP